jgi:glutathione synthase/RimK-type ligase-like ATP-grasp enzyme
MPRIALATYAAFPDLPPDDQIFQRALEARGAVAPAVLWDAGVDWSAFDAVVVRSCWDYHLRHAAFLSWIGRVERSGAVLHNAASILRWNSDKRYLRDLEMAGVDVVHTRWSDETPELSLAEVLAAEGWDEVVIKPAISASATDTWRIPPGKAGDWEARFREMTRRGPIMIQPFVAEVSVEGEWSLVFIGGEFSHAMLKRPAPGDFRVQAELGGTQQAITADPALVRVAREVLAQVPGAPSYARIDGCVVNGRFRIMEVELLEPTLYFTEGPAAAERLAALVLEGLPSPSPSSRGQ